MATHFDLDFNERSQPGSTASDLLAAAKRFEPEAWRQLVERYSWLVSMWCKREGLAADDVPDVLQAVLAEVARNLERFHKDGQTAAFRRWLRAITRCQAAEFRRRAAKQPRALGGTTANERLMNLSTNESPTESDPRLEHLLERFWKLVERLEEVFEASTWQAFWMTMFEHRTSVEVAQVLGLSPAAVRLAKARVLRRIREEDARLANELKGGRREAPQSNDDG